MVFININLPFKLIFQNGYPKNLESTKTLIGEISKMNSTKINCHIYYFYIKTNLFSFIGLF